jgi:hypothetical protein
MKKSLFAALAFTLVMASPLFAQSGGASLSKALPGLEEADWLQTKNGFGAQMFLTDSEEMFVKWVKTDVKSLSALETTHRNHPVYLAVFFANPGETRTGRADVTYDMQILKPDGSKYGEQGNIPAWKGYAPAKHLVELANGKVTVNFEVIDPAGTYTVRIIVHDNVNKIDIPIQRKITLLD